MKALLLIAHGSEDMETVITSDILHRGGIQVCHASVASKPGEPLHCANGVKVVADTTFEQVYDAGHALDYDILVLPGGSKGYQTFSKDHRVQDAIKQFAASEKHKVAAICASPMAVWDARAFAGARVTCYPGCEERLPHDLHYRFVNNEKTVVDGRLITSRGPGTAIDFALTILKETKGMQVRDKVAQDILAD